MRYFYFILGFIMLSACNTVKKTQTAINSGNYDQAIAIALDKLRDGKDKRGNQEYVYLLEEAFAKSTERDLRQIRAWNMDADPNNLEKIYEAYVRLERRQEQIRPLLPLYLQQENREARFIFKSYTQETIKAKEELTVFLYENAVAALPNAMNKQEFRAIYDDLDYLNRITPNFRDVPQMMEEAHFRGTDFIRLTLSNDTQVALPERLEQELLDISTYELNDHWRVYHSTPVQNVDYSYGVDLRFTDIAISPEQVKETVISREKEIVSGWQYATDRNGNQIKDSLGKPVKVDTYKTVRCDLHRFEQFKNAAMQAQVRIVSLGNGQTLRNFPLQSQFIFQHLFAEAQGDERALSREEQVLLPLGALPFPPNEQLIYEAGRDLKAQFSNLIRRQDLFL